MANEPTTVRIGTRRLDLGTRTLRGPSGEDRLTPTEVELVRYLLNHPHRTIPREELLAQVWGYRPGVRSRTVDTHMGRLRAKIGEAHIHTIHGVGYRFEPEDTSDARPGQFFTGREAEIHQASALLERSRQITIKGPAGAGKTRLAERVADANPLPSVVAELAGDTSADALSGAVCEALMLPRDADLDRALPALGPTLLVIDQLDPIVETAGPVLQRWLDEAPELLLIVTSRRRLRIPGEAVLDLGGLAPAAARRLFLHRAGWADAEDEPALSKILERLDHLPLAIELAAAWADVLSLADLADRLGRSLSLLDGGVTSLQARHQSVQIAVQSSWDLLDEADRNAWVDLTVFPASFTLAQAEEVLGPRAAFAIRALRDASLIRPVGDRFALYEATRDFALGQAEDERHLAHLIALGPGVATHGTAADRELMFACFEAALNRQGDLAARLAWALSEILEAEGPATDRLEVLRRVAAADLEPSSLRARLLVARAHFEVVLGHDARGALDEAEEACAALGDDSQASVVGLRASWLRIRGRYDEAAEQLAAALAGNGLPPHRRATLLRFAGHVALFRGKTDAALQHCTEALAQAERASKEGALRDLVGFALGDLGVVALSRGAHSDAERHLTEALDAFERRRTLRHQAQCLEVLAQVRMDQADLDEADALLGLALDLNRRARYAPTSAFSDLRLGQLRHLQDQPDEACAHYALAAERFHSVHDSYGEGLTRLFWSLIAPDQRLRATRLLRNRGPVEDAAIDGGDPDSRLAIDLRLLGRLRADLSP